MKRALSARELTLIVILLIIVFGCLYYLLLYTPIMNNIEEQNNLELDYQAEAEIESVRYITKVTMQESVDRALAEGNTTPIPAYDNINQLMPFLNTLMQQTTDYSLSFAEEQVSSGYIIRPINMTFTCGSYAAARGIVASLIKGDYRCNIGNVTFSNEGEGGDFYGSAVKVSLETTFYELIEQ